MRMIDKDEAIKILCDGCTADCDVPYTVCITVQKIIDMPTIEPEVRHGRWEKVPYISHCGCGKKFDVFRYNCSECNRTSEFQAYGLRFCPYCGADNGDAIKGGADNG